MNKRTLAISCSLAFLYTIVLCCAGAFGEAVSSWFMSWIPMTLRILAILAGFLIVAFLPIRIEHALMYRKEQLDYIVRARNLEMLEKKQKQEDNIAKIMEKVNSYE